MTEVTIQIDQKHKALRSGNQWAVQRLTRDGVYDTVDTWTGNRRSLLHWLEAHKIHPTRIAEQQLAALPERTGFRENPK